MRYMEIDGERYEIEDCGHCPFGDMSDAGGGEYCTHPKSGQDPRTPLDIDYNGFAKSCPLRDVQEDLPLTQAWYKSNMNVVMDAEKGIPHEVRPCPFCGSTGIEERYFDDDCEEIEEWMVEEANSYVKEDGGEPYNSIDEYREVNAYYWQVYCPRCNVYMTSGLSMKDAWAKWNRRAL